MRYRVTIELESSLDPKAFEAHFETVCEQDHAIAGTVSKVTVECLNKLPEEICSHLITKPVGYSGKECVECGKRWND